MKSILLYASIFFVFNIFCQNTILRDTTFWKNSQIREVYDFDTIKYRRCGYYAEFDTLGRKLVEGNFKIVDSIKCKDCFEIQYDGSYFPIDYSMMNELKVGEWIFYHHNGKIKEKGSYGDLVSEFRGSVIPYGNEDWYKPANIYIEVDYLKEATWQYYDEDGKNYKTIIYHNGTIVNIIERR